MTMISGFANRNREGIYAESMTTSVGKPITLTEYAQDRRDYEELKQTIFLLGTECILHQGPARPDFSSEKITVRDRAKAGEDLVQGVFIWGALKLLICRNTGESLRKFLFAKTHTKVISFYAE
jgi:hypothetical protein